MVSDSRDGECNSTKETYRQLLAEYGEAVKTRDPGAKDLLDRAAIAWRTLCACGGVEAESAGMHIVLAFSMAAAGGDAAEAERLYNEMDEEDRRGADYSEALEPGSVKIWLRK